MIRTPRYLFPEIDNIYRYAKRSVIVSNRYIRWEFESKILWAYSDKDNALLMYKIEDSHILDFLPDFSCGLDRGWDYYYPIEDKKFQYQKSLKEIYGKFSTKIESQYRISEGCTLSIVKPEIKNLIYGKVTIQCMNAANTIRFEKLEIRENCIRLLKKGEIQLFIGFRQIEHFRPSKVGVESFLNPID